MFKNPMEHQNLEKEILTMFKSLIAAHDVEIIKQATGGLGEKFHLRVTWDIDESLYPQKRSVSDIAEFFHKFCECFAERMSVGSYKGMRQQFYELQSASLLKQSELQAKIDDLMRYKHAYDLGVGKQ